MTWMRENGPESHRCPAAGRPRDVGCQDAYLAAGPPDGVVAFRSMWVALQADGRLARAVRRSQLRWPMSAFCSSVKGEFSRKERASPLLVST